MSLTWDEVSELLAEARAARAEYNDTSREGYLTDLVLRLAGAVEDCRDGGVTS